MKHVAVASAIVLAFGVMARAQDEAKRVEPGKEHQLLKQFEGEWEFKAKCMMPGQDPKEGQGTDVSHLGYGGFWLECEEKGTMMGKDFMGKSICGYDPQKKKFRGVWFDNWSPFMGRFEGEAETSGKVFTFQLKMDGMKGEKKAHPEKMVWEFKDQDHRWIRFYGKDDSGKEVMFSEITYSRKSAK